MWGKGTRIARLRGFDIKVDASWFLIAALIVWSLATAYFPADLPAARTETLVAIAIVAMLGLFASLILHELAHAEVARRYGLGVTGITLFLFGGVAELDSEPLSGRSEFWIAIAGPLASLGLAAAFWCAAALAGLAGMPDPGRLVLSYLAWINAILALFNLLPAYPMDGGRVLRAWLWARSGDVLGATRRATDVAAVVAYGLMALGLFGAFSGGMAAGVWPILVGVFLLATSRAALAQIETRAALHPRRVADLMTRRPLTAGPDQSLADVVNRIILERGASFVPVVEDGVLLGYVDVQIVRGIDREHWTTTTIDDVLEAASPANTVDPDLTGLDLMGRILDTGRRKFLVARGDDLLGVVTLADVLTYLQTFRDVSAAPPARQAGGTSIREEP